jgi:hypothetical protein
MVSVRRIADRGGTLQETAMAVTVQTYTETAIARGACSSAGRFREELDLITELVLDQATVMDLAEGDPLAHPSYATPVDDLLIVAADDDPAIPVHAAWHQIHLQVGPYEVQGELSTMPGFDPGRALTRPTGSFVLLRDVAITLIDRPDAGESHHAHALVNRYTVDAVEADIMLGFFFPGAAMDQPEGTHAPLSAGVAAPTPDAAADAVSPASPEPATPAGPN